MNVETSDGRTMHNSACIRENKITLGAKKKIFHKQELLIKAACVYLLALVAHKEQHVHGTVKKGDVSFSLRALAKKNPKANAIVRRMIPVILSLQ